MKDVYIYFLNFIQLYKSYNNLNSYKLDSSNPGNLKNI